MSRGPYGSAITRDCHVESINACSESELSQIDSKSRRILISGEFIIIRIDKSEMLIKVNVTI